MKIYMQLFISRNFEIYILYTKNDCLVKNSKQRENNISWEKQEEAIGHFQF